MNRLYVEIGTDDSRSLDEALVLLGKVFTMRCPSDRELKVLQQWLNDPKGGNEFLRHFESRTWRDARIEDTVSLSNQRFDDDAFSNWLTEKAFSWYHDRYGRHFQVLRSLNLEHISLTKATNWIGHQKPVAHDEESGFSDYSYRKISMLINVVSIAMSLLLILLSIVVLYFTPSPRLRLFVAALFTFLFTLMMAAVTSAGRLQLFVASAT